MKLVICGGGISGIASAYYASLLLPKICGNKFQITLLEKENVVGGWMMTREKKGSINEWGPHSVRFTGKSATLQERNTLALINELGLDHLLLPATGESVAAKTRLIYANSRLHKLPSDFVSANLPSSMHAKPLSVLLLQSLFKKVPKDAETVHDILSAKMGENFASLYASSFCRGIFAGDSRKLSMKAAFPQFYKKLHGLPSNKLQDFEERFDVPNLKSLQQSTAENPLVKRAVDENWKMWTSQYGLNDLSRRIAQRICEECPNVKILTSTDVSEISQQSDGKMTVHAENAQGNFSIDNIDRIVSGIPSYNLQQVLKRGAETSQINNKTLSKISRLLGDIHWSDVAVVHVEYRGPVDQVLPTLGFGHLVPSTEKSNLLGVIYDSCLFPHHDRTEDGTPTTRLTCMMGGSWFEEVFGGGPDTVSHETIRNMASEGVREQLGITEDPLDVNVMICRKCIPLYQTNHTDLVRNMEYLLQRKEIPISLAGSSYWGVSVNDCIYNSRSIMSRLYEEDQDLPEAPVSTKDYLLSRSFIYRKLTGTERRG